MKIRINMTIVLLSFFLLCGEQAFGYILTFDSITNTNAENVAIGESQFTVDVTDPGNNEVLFTFHNIGGYDATISEIYFDDGSLLGISRLVENPEYDNQSKSGVDFNEPEEGIEPPDLPGGSTIVPEFEVTAWFWTEADNPASKKGIDPEESLEVYFDLQSGKTYYDVLNALSNPNDTENGLRIGLHAISMGEDEGSESFVNIAVPIPGAIWLFVTGGSAAIARFRKERKGNIFT